MVGGSSGKFAESEQNHHNDLLDGSFTVFDRMALSLIPQNFTEKYKKLCARQKRSKSPRPGGSARRFSYGTRLEDGQSYLTMIKHCASEGGHIEFVISANGTGTARWTLSGKELRILNVSLPETVKNVLATFTGKPVGDLVEITGSFSDVMSCKILHIEDKEGVAFDKSNIHINLEVASCQLSRDDALKNRRLKLLL